jgi:hypothetical protein
VLASPFVGVSNDALVQIRQHAGPAAALHRDRALAARGLDERDEQLVRAFKQRYERLVAASARVSLERLLRAGRLRARLRPRRARALGRAAAATRTCAS